MREIFIEDDNLTSAYFKALVKLNDEGEVLNCEDWNCKQKEVSMTIHILNPLQNITIPRFIICTPESLEQYTQEMIDGILDWEVDNGLWNYTYHRRMYQPINQVQFVIDELRRNPSSRRAVINVRSLDDIGSNDPACLQEIQFFVRDDKLDCCVLFRSNDAVKATYMNIFALVMLQKKVADELGVEVGTYTHRANSFHCYEADFKTLENSCTAIKNKSIDKITFDYETNWKSKMEQSKSIIAKKIEELKKRDN